MVFKTIKKRRGHGVKGETAENVYISGTRSGAKKGHQQRQLCLTIGELVMEKARWVCGDRVEVSIGEDDDSGLILIKRLTGDRLEFGYTLSGIGKNSLENRGKPTKCDVRITLDVFMIPMLFPERDFSRRLTAHEITPDGLLISYDNGKHLFKLGAIEQNNDKSEKEAEERKA